MQSKNLQDYFQGVATKYLSIVDANPKRSNQHEIGGLVSVGFKQYLGDGSDTYSYDCLYVYIADEDEPPVLCHHSASWYDARRDDPNRSSEYRLYYQSNTVTELMEGGDFFLIAKLADNSLLMVITPSGSIIEQQLRSVFQIDEVVSRFQYVAVKDTQLIFPIRVLFESMGLVFDETLQEQDYLNLILERFPDGFPSTKVFSTFAMETLGELFDPVSNPDDALMKAIEREEFLFRLYEKYLVKDRLLEGFGDNVDLFIKYSLSIQNRRKSRVGYAFEHHLEAVFVAHGLQFEQGRRAGQVTENKAKPDFIFPSFGAYHSVDFNINALRVLGAKTTCKDRWRQVLSEADRVEYKHLVTLQSGISIDQTNEMKAKKLQLVVPYDAQYAYTEEQKSWLYTLADFIEEILKIQR